MSVRRNMFHHDGVTDATVMRNEAARAGLRGELVLLHLHPYEELWDGCRNADTPEHERFGEW